MIKAIKKILKKRRLKKAIKQSSFNCQSMEMASFNEWEELRLERSYEKEMAVLDNLREQLNAL